VWATQGTTIQKHARVLPFGRRGDSLLADRRSTPVEIQSGSRQRADGVTLAWRLTDPEPLAADGVVPFFIDWGSSPHPTRSAAQGASLVSFHVEHHGATGVQRMLRALGLDVTVVPANRAALVAVIDSPRGRVELR
jgi:hypothetical protein